MRKRNEELHLKLPWAISSSGRQFQAKARNYLHITAPNILSSILSDGNKNHIIAFVKKDFIIFY